MIDLNTLREQNMLIRQKLEQIKQNKQIGPGLRTQIEKFTTESKKNLKQMNQRSIAEQEKRNQQLHVLTQQYESVLKEQIALLTQNKSLSQKKDEQDQKFNQHVESLTKQYELQIAQFEKKVKINVKKIQQMGGGNIIKRLAKNPKFKAAMAERGCKLQGLEKQSELEDVADQVEEKEKQIEAAQTKSTALDEQLQKMHQLIETMKQLMENMQKQKQNILKQNTILKQKLEQSQELIGKLLGSNGGNDQEEENNQDQEQEKVNDE